MTTTVIQNIHAPVYGHVAGGNVTVLHISCLAGCLGGITGEDVFKCLDVEAFEGGRQVDRGDDLHHAAKGTP